MNDDDAVLGGDFMARARERQEARMAEHMKALLDEVGKAEEARKEAARPEIRKLDALEGDIASAWLSQTFTAAQLIAVFAERRKIIELRARLSGVMPTPTVEDM